MKAIDPVVLVACGPTRDAASPPVWIADHEWLEGAMTFENDRPVRTASSEQVRRPIYRDGVDQWRHFEPWLDPLKEALGEVLTADPAAPPSAR